MARIAGINIPTNKRVEIALTYIHGIGLSSSKKICELAGIIDEKFKLNKINHQFHNVWFVSFQQCFQTGSEHQTDTVSAKMPALPVLFISYSCQQSRTKSKVHERVVVIY